MKTASVKVTNRLGVHARPSGLIVRIAQKFESQISFIKGEQIADAKSIMALMMLAMQSGETIAIQAEGVDEEDAVHALESLFRERFHED